ncbi:hypothetical protein CPB85DRAFT_1278 [Mucidula mucida]|nr:hypothetical protein CPB85DRAFT_1278 [Mucidula mucida]
MSPSLHDVRALTGEATQLSPTSLAIILSIIGVLLLGGLLWWWAMTRPSRRQVMAGYIDGDDVESFAALNEKRDSLSATVGGSGRWVPQVPTQPTMSTTKWAPTRSLTSSTIAEIRTPPPSYVFFVANATTDLGSPLFDPPPEARQSVLNISPARNSTSRRSDPSLNQDDIRSHSAPHSLPRLMTAITIFTPTHDDELPIAVGDVVHLLLEFADGWCLVQEVGGKDARKGVVPRLCLSEHHSITSPEKAASSQHSRAGCI